MAKLKIAGELYDIPDEDDWELGELAEVQKLNAEYGGELGSLIGTVWIVKHRIDRTYTIAEAKLVKLGAFEEVADEPDPLPESSAPSNGTESGKSKPSRGKAPALGGPPSSSVSTG
jgi:hypothetical protein